MANGTAHDEQEVSVVEAYDGGKGMTGLFTRVYEPVAAMTAQPLLSNSRPLFHYLRHA